MIYLKDITEDGTLYLFFTTSDGSGGAVAPSTAFEAADVDIYKNDSVTQKTSTNGLTMTSPFDSTTGLHLLTIDTSNDTGDTGFWETGNTYTVVLTPDETVDSQTVVFAWQFSIEDNSQFALVVRATAGASSTTTTIVSTSLTEATNDHYIGRIVVFTDGALAGQATKITDYDGTAKTLTVDTMTEAPASGDSFVVV
jgi:hypothetical protein